MNPETATKVTKDIGALLLLGKPENRIGNLLAILGLFPTDFSMAYGQLLVSYDENGVLIEADEFVGLCTCSEDPKSPRLHLVPNDPERHSSRCDAYRAYTIGVHPNLVDLEPIERDGRKRTVFNFAWPRVLETRNQNVLVTHFGELQAEKLWENFKRSWTKIMELLPPAPKSYAERLSVEEVPSPEAPTMDFGDMDFGVTSEPVANGAVDLTPEVEKPLEQVAEETAKKRKRKEKAEAEEAPAPAPAPETEAPVNETSAPVSETKAPEGETPAVPKETLKKEKKEKKEKEEPKKTIPTLLKFKAMADEELAGILSSVQFIADAESFPIEAIKSLKARIDRLALKAAHLAYRGGHDLERPSAINPIVEITLANVTQSTNSAIRDLGLCPEKPNSWVDFQKEMKDIQDVAKAMAEIMAQTGIGPVVQEPPKLKDSDGKALVP